jgi:HAAS domain-containing protein
MPVTADDYVRRVEFALRDLPWRQRRDLVTELRDHLAELPPDTKFGERLGTPERYAADLRSAAGLERRRGVMAFLRARRPRNLILFVLALIVIGLTVGAVSWIDSYQPLAYGNQTQLPLNWRSSIGQPGVTVVFRKGHPFLYGITIRNDRRFAVRVLGVPMDATRFYYFRARLFTSKPSVNDQERPLVPFHPFDLQPGQERWLVFKGVFACTGGEMFPGEENTWEDIGVRYTFLWRTGTATIPLGTPLEIRFPKGGCPPKR